MARTTYHAPTLRSFLRKHKIAALDTLKQALGTTATMTVFRKLKALGYRASYSHRGKYYALAEIPAFDAHGLWSCRSVWFSKYGNLLQTARHFVLQAEAGLTAGELESLLHVEVKGALLQLVRRKQIDRERLGGIYVYFTRAPDQGHNQRLCRAERQAAWDLGAGRDARGLGEELKAAILLFYSLLDERQRRVYAGLESYKLGHGGDRKIATLLGLDVHTVARGRRELLGGHVHRHGVRSKGGGRKPMEKKRRR